MWLSAVLAEVLPLLGCVSGVMMLYVDVLWWRSKSKAPEGKGMQFLSFGRESEDDRSRDSVRVMRGKQR